MMGNLMEQGANLRGATGLGSGEAHQEVRKTGRGTRGAESGGEREKGIQKDCWARLNPGALTTGDSGQVGAGGHVRLEGVRVT